MKNIIITILILLPFLTNAQAPIVYEDTGYVQKALWAKSLLLPPRDTLPHKRGFALIGNNIWIGNGTKWNLTKSVDSGFFSATYAQRTLGARFNFNHTLMDWDSVKFKFGDTVRVNGKLIGYNVRGLGGFETNSFDSSALSRVSVDAVTGVQLQWASATTSLLNSLKIDSTGTNVLGKVTFPSLSISANSTDSMVVKNSTGGIGIRVIPSGSSCWGLNGNAGTTISNFLGTSDAQPLYFKTNGSQVGKLGTDFSVGLGYLANANGNYSTSIGFVTTANGFGSLSLGYGTIATGASSTATGNQSNSLGDASFVTGTENNSRSYSEAVFGMFNTTYTPTSVSSWVSTDRIFNVGNGANSGARSDAMVILKNGNVGIGTSTPSVKLDVVGDIKVKHIIGLTSAPTISLGASLGTGGTASISGTDLAGTITLNIGTSPPVTTPGIAATVTFNTVYSVAPKSIVLTSANEFAQESYFNGGWFVDVASITTSEFKVYSYSRGNAYPNTTMKFFYQVLQ